MIYHASKRTAPHLFPLGHVRTINGVRCVLISYTPGKSPRPKYRRPDGTTVTVHAGKVNK
jgi:hypothetical protein